MVRKRKMPRRKSYKKRVRTYVSRGYRNVRGLGGNLSLMPMLTGAAAITLLDRYQPFGGAFRTPLNKIIAGLGLSFAGMNNYDLVTVGIKEAVSNLINTYLPDNQAGSGDML